MCTYQTNTRANHVQVYAESVRRGFLLLLDVLRLACTMALPSNTGCNDSVLRSVVAKVKSWLDVREALGDCCKVAGARPAAAQVGADAFFFLHRYRHTFEW